MSLTVHPINPSGSIALRAGWLIDGTGRDARPDRLIIVRSGRIHSIDAFKSHDIALPGFVDLSDHTIIPILMDAHVHLTFSGTCDPAQRKAQLGQTVAQSDQAISKHLLQSIDHGIGALRDAGDHRGDLLRYKHAHAHMGVDVKAAGWALRAKGRYGRMIGQPAPVENGLDASIEWGPQKPDHLKVINSGINSLDRFGHETAPQFTAGEMECICRYAQQNNLPVMVHANGRLAVRSSIDAGCRSIEHGYFMGRDNLGRMAEKGVFWVPTAIPMAVLTQAGVVAAGQAEVARRTLDHQLEQIFQGHRLGVTIALGTDAGSMGVDHGVAVRQELDLLIQAGLSLGQAIRCATLNAAALMGTKNKGAIMPAQRTDLMAVKAPAHMLPHRLGDMTCIYRFQRS